MTAKEYLNQPYKIKKKIKYLKLDLERYEKIIYSCPSPNYENVRVDISLIKETPNQIALEKCDEIKNKIKCLEEELEKVIKEVNKTIDRIDNDDYKLILKYRYLDGMSYGDIKEKLFVSYSSIKRWHNDALVQISQILKVEP